MVACDDDEADAGAAAASNGLGDLRPGRIEQRNEPEQDEVALGVLPPLRRQHSLRQPPTGHREHAETLRRVALDHREHPDAVALAERHISAGRSERGRTREHLLRRTLHVQRQPAVTPIVDARHQAQLRVEAVEPASVVLATGDGDVDAERPRRLEQPNLGRFAPRLPAAFRRQLRCRASRDRTAEQAEARLGER